MRIRIFLTITMLSVFLAAVPGFGQEGGYVFMPRGANFLIYHTSSKDFIINQSKITGWKLQKDFASIASGKKVITAADDPAVLAVSEKMNAVLNGLKQEAKNAEDMRNYLQYVDLVLGQNMELLNRIRLLILQASGGIYGPDEREINQTEIDQLLDQIDMNAEFTDYNKKLVIPFLTVKALGLESVNVVKNPTGSMKLVDAAHGRIIRLRASAGVKANVLTFEIQGKLYQALNMEESVSKMVDTDIAEAVSSLAKHGILYKTQNGMLLKAK